MLFVFEVANEVQWERLGTRPFIISYLCLELSRKTLGRLWHKLKFSTER